MSNESPFLTARHEHDGQPAYFLPKNFTELEGPKPLYVVGSRGTGKTTFLRALTWHERLNNSSLQRQLLERDGGLFEGRYLGVYLKLPKSQLHLFDRWLDGENEMYTDVLALHVGLMWVELIAEAIAEFIERSQFDVDPGREAQVVAGIAGNYSGYGAFDHFLPTTTTSSLRDLQRGTRAIRRELEQTAQRRVPFEAAVPEFPFERLAAFAEFAAHELAKLLPSDQWSFRVCMDEGESMSKRQQIAMNSIVRGAEWPVVPVVAYVSLSPWANDTDSSLRLARADVDDIVLDDMSETEFTQFVSGVAAVRLQSDSTERNVPAELQENLGRLDLNALLGEILSRSSSDQARTLLAKARENAALPYFQEANTNALPIYQTHLVEALDLPVPDEMDEVAERRQKSAEIRKRNVAAYLDICSTLSGTKPLYASMGMVVQMSDNCVRDFLWQLQELYVESGSDPYNFATTPILARTQSAALTRASRQKMGRIARVVQTEPQRAERMVDGLARLTASLQRPTVAASGDHRHLRTPEPGWWCLPDPGAERLHPVLADPSDLPLEYRLVLDAVESGYLRLEPSGKAMWRFRVHTSLAAHYGFSYRGAQYDVPFRADGLRRLSEAQAPSAREATVAELYEALRPHSLEQTSIFDQEFGQ